MLELPIVPGAVHRSRFEHERERDRLVLARRKRPRSLRRAIRRLERECATETLCLTGAPVVLDESAGTLPGHARARDLMEGQMAALHALQQSAVRGVTLNSSVLLDVHRLACPPHGGVFRKAPGRIRFAGAVPSPPNLISERIDGLTDWLASEGVGVMTVPEKAALAFTRLVEIAPFDEGNFRVAHLLLSYFAAAGNYPPLFFRRAESRGVREDIERALRFDTRPLVLRLTDALLCSLRSCLEETGEDAEGPAPTGER